MQVSELMIPVGEYKTVDADASLSDVITVLADSDHRDVLVINADGNLEGIITMTDILMALEPNYKKLGQKDLHSDTLSNRYVADIFKEFGLWTDPLSALCEKSVGIKTADIMYVPAEGEYLDEDDDLEYGIHRYIVGIHQPALVRRDGIIVGVLRLSDIFNEIKNRMLTCID